MRLLTETDTPPPLWLNLLSPSRHPALQAMPVRRLSCGPDSSQFPSRGSQAKMFSVQAPQGLAHVSWPAGLRGSPAGQATGELARPNSRPRRRFRR